MSILPLCPTPVAVLVCAVRDAKGVLRLPHRVMTPGLTGAAPGLVFAVQPMLPINAQLVAIASAFFSLDVALLLRIEQEFADPAGADATLYLATLDAAVVAAPDWLTFPAVLRQVQGRARIPYLRAWQILAGGLHLDTKAIETAELPTGLLPPRA